MYDGDWQMIQTIVEISVDGGNTWEVLDSPIHQSLDQLDQWHRSCQLCRTNNSY